MILNNYRAIAQQEWQNTSEIQDSVALHEFMVMPDHFQGLMEIKFQKGNNEPGKFKSPSQTVGAIIRGYKIATIKMIKDLVNSTGEMQFAPTAPPTEKIKELNFKIWQRNYYEHIIRNDESYERISSYISDNPKRWNEDKFYGILQSLSGRNAIRSNRQSAKPTRLNH